MHKRNSIYSTEEKFYLYRHIRVDKNEVFYVGIGTKNKYDFYNATYNRAETFTGRTGLWKIITKKSSYLVEIVLESDSYEFIEKKEREFIKLYGRKDLGTGTLTNLTDGGRENDNKSQATKNKALQTLKNNGGYERNIAIMKAFAALNGHPDRLCNKKTYKYSLLGEFIQEYESRKLCRESNGLAMVSISTSIKNKTSVNGFFYTSEYLQPLNISLFSVNRLPKRKIIQICPKTFIKLKSFESLSEAAIEIKGNKANIGHSTKRFIKCKGFYWTTEEDYEQYIIDLKTHLSKPIPQYLKDNAKNHLAEFRRLNPQHYENGKKMINTKTGQIFKSAKDAAIHCGLTPSTFHRNINKKNKIPYKYL